MTRKTKRWLIGSGIAVVVLIALGYGAIFIYANIINDSPDELDADDLASALDATTTLPSGGGDTASSAPDTTTSTADGATDATVPATTTASGETGGSAAFTGTWALTPESIVRYRVDEVLFGVNTTAVGETNQVEGSIAMDDTGVNGGDFTVDVATMQSDSGRRDGQFRGRIMETEQFPTATFELTEPIELNGIPGRGEQAQASATGELTMHGVTNAVTFDVTAETRDNRVGVLGQIPVEFADYDIENPSFSGVTTEDNGVIEFVLVFQPA